jgi:hypothetical protein
LATLVVAAWALILAVLACALVVLPDESSDRFRDHQGRQHVGLHSSRPGARPGHRERLRVGEFACGYARMLCVRLGTGMLHARLIRMPA